MNGVLRIEEGLTMLRLATHRQATLIVISLRPAKKVGEEEESIIESENDAKDTIFTQCCICYRLT
jgi:hypothetical protein